MSNRLETNNSSNSEATANRNNGERSFRLLDEENIEIKGLNNYSNYYAYFSEASGFNDIEAHLKEFKDGGSFIVGEYGYNNFIKNGAWIGYKEDQTNYMIPKNKMNEIIKDFNDGKYDISALEDKFGFPRGQLGEGFYRIDVKEPFKHNIRMATGTEMGGNPYYNTNDIKDIKTTNNSPEKRSTPDRPHKWINVFDLNGSSKIPNGEYYEKITKGGKTAYVYHQPNLEGYIGTTSGGLKEAVVSLIPNDTDSVEHTKYTIENNKLNAKTLTDAHFNYNPENIPIDKDRIGVSGDQLNIIGVSRDQLNVLSKFKEALELKFESFPSGEKDRFIIACSESMMNKITNLEFKERTVNTPQRETLEKIDLMLRKNGPNDIPKFEVSKDQFNDLSSKKKKEKLDFESSTFKDKKGKEHIIITCSESMMEKMIRLNIIERPEKNYNRLNDKMFFCLKDDETIMYPVKFEKQIDALLTKMEMMEKIKAIGNIKDLENIKDNKVKYIVDHIDPKTTDKKPTIPRSKL